jgi:hypothetical protein
MRGLDAIFPNVLNASLVQFAAGWQHGAHSHLHPTMPRSTSTPSSGLAWLLKKLTPESATPTFSIAVLLLVPLAVGIIHAVFNISVMSKRGELPVEVPTHSDVPSQVVFAARLGECSETGDYQDGARGIFMPAMLTVWMRNFDGWMLDRATAEESLLKGSGFTAATFRSYLSLRGRKGSVQSWAEEEAFRAWLLDLIQMPLVKQTPGIPDLSTLAQVLLASGASAKDLPVKVDERMQQLHETLLALVKKTPSLLDGFKIADELPHTLETFTRFIAERGMSWPQKLKEDTQRFQAWLESSRLSLVLTIGGHEFVSILPDAKGASRIRDGVLKGQTSADTIQMLLFRHVAPATEQMDVWRQLVATYGVDSKAPITVSLRVTDDRGITTVLKLPSLVNGGAVGRNHPLMLPLRPVLMRSIAWAALAGVLWLIILVSMLTGTLRVSVPEGHSEVTDWTKSPWSASRVVFAWWLAICTGCYLFLWAMKAEMDVLTGSAPLLLGLNGGTLLAASFVGSGRVLRKSRSFLEDIVSEGGEAEVSRLQMLVWNGVLGVIFIWQSIANWQMPEFDANLTTILGISSTAYVSYKAVPAKTASGAPPPPAQTE